MWDLFFNPLELTATLTGTASVYLSFRKNILTYFFGLISVSIYVYICFFAGLYADMGINVFYFIMSVYGWINWSRMNSKDSRFHVFRLSFNENIFYAVLTATSWLIIYFILKDFTDSKVPVTDAFTTAMFITGMILMAKKFTENWIYLLIGNLVSIPLYFYKELYPSAGFFVILSVFSLLGFYSWKKSK
jgi:nicotinamide mononucleotide transporter